MQKENTCNAEVARTVKTDSELSNLTLKTDKSSERVVDSEFKKVLHQQATIKAQKLEIIKKWKNPNKVTLRENILVALQ